VPLVVALFLALVACASAATSSAAPAQVLEARVIAVADGDTITVLDSNQVQHRIRLAGIDAPEKGQPFSENSRQALAGKVHQRTVSLQWMKPDRHGRLLAKVLVEGADVNLAQVHAGLAWHYKAYANEQSRADRDAYAAAELGARERRIGLWSQATPVPPWDWRRGPDDGDVRKSRNDICHVPGMSSYSSVQKFESFPTLEACISSGGRLPGGNPPPR
jgi:endonuclease YncB( thermonuclease family)